MFEQLNCDATLSVNVQPDLLYCEANTSASALKLTTSTDQVKQEWSTQITTSILVQVLEINAA